MPNNQLQSFFYYTNGHLNIKMSDIRHCVQVLKLNNNAGLVRNASKGCTTTSFSYFTSAIIIIQAPLPFRHQLPNNRRK